MRGLGRFFAVFLVVAAIVTGSLSATASVSTSSVSETSRGADPAQFSLQHLLQRTTGASANLQVDSQRQVTSQQRKRLKRATTTGKPWNVVVIVTDDQPTGTVVDMPTVSSRLAERGINFSAGLIPTPVCCPSRASLLTGLFATSTGVYDNTQGGVPGANKAFVQNGNEQKVFPLAMQRRGYRTGIFGKYLNQFGNTYRGFAPPGWDEFVTFRHKSGYNNFSVTNPYGPRQRLKLRKGRSVAQPTTRRVNDYSTTFFGERTAQFIRSTPRRQPLMALYTPYAPHMPAKPEEKYKGTLADTGWWLTDPSVMEADVRDKPEWVIDTPVSPSVDRRPLGHRLLKQRQTLLSVDDEVDRILKALKQTNRINRTVIIFTSDNGYMHGQHRLSRKGVPYRAATEVPLIVRVGNRNFGGVVDDRAAAANVDVAATALALIGAENTTEGTSLLAPAAAAGIPLLGVAASFEGVARPPYCGWRTAREMFVRYGSGEEEYYNYGTDPYELENAVDDPAAADRVEALRAAARAACDPAPPKFGPDFDTPTWQYGDRVPLSDRDAQE